MYLYYILNYLINQYMNEVNRERRKEKPTKAKNPEKLREGISIHLLVKPAK